MRGALGRVHWLAGYELIVVAYVIGGLFLAELFGFRLDLRLIADPLLVKTLLILTWLAVVLLFWVSGIRAQWTESDRRAFGPCWRRRMREQYLTPQHAYDLVKTFLLLKLVFLTYGTIKQAIPRVTAGVYDRELLAIDAWLHGGANPMRFTVELLGAPGVSGLLDVLYVGWYFVMPVTVIVFVITKDRRLHAQFFGSFYSLWILGGLTALLLPSLGPIYVWPEWFESLDKPLATSLQQRLWIHYAQMRSDPATYRTLIYEGIAAFPSLHVAAVALFAMFLWRLSRAASSTMWIYTLLIQIGSVFLGWHYAVDGYFGIVLAYALFWLFTRKLHPPGGEVPPPMAPTGA